MSNLRLINETEVTSGVSTVNITDVFSADFDIYKVVINSLKSTSNAYYYLRFLNSSSSAVTTNNDNAGLLMRTNSTFVEYKGTNTASVWHTSNLVTSTVGGNNGVFYFFNPYSSSSYTFMLGQDSKVYSSNNRNYKHIGVNKSTQSMTGISILNYSSTFTGGTINIYGLRVDS